VLKSFYIYIVGFLILTTSLLSLPKCSYKFITKQKNISKTYYNLRNHKKKCYLTVHHFLEFAKRSFLAGRLSESLWASNYGLKTSKNEFNVIPLRYIKAMTLFEKNRLEEAIISLKKIYNQSIKNKNLKEYKEKALLLLIKIYYKKHNQRDKNVAYLLRLYRSKYKESKYYSLVSRWQK